MMTLRKTLLSTFIIIILTIHIFIPNRAIALEADQQSAVYKLEKKIAKSYASKYCNAIAIGVSQEGAIKLAISENSEASFNPSLWSELLFSGKENLNLVNEERVADEVSEEVIKNCGGAIGLNGRKGVEEFKDYFNSKYISTKK